MRIWMIRAAIGMLPALAAPQDGNAPAAPADEAAASAERIAQLVEQLGSPRHAKREAAQAALLEIGRPALRALRAATEDTQAERAARAASVARQIEEAAARATVRRVERRLAALLGEPCEAAADEGAIELAIRRLGSSAFRERQAAQRELVRIGLPAVPALRAASDDPHAERAAGAKAVLDRLALRRESWPIRWRGLTCTVRLLVPEPAQCVGLHIDADRRVRLIRWDARTEAFVRGETTLSREDARLFYSALSGGRPWRWGDAPVLPEAPHGGRLEVLVTVNGQFARMRCPWPMGDLARSPQFREAASHYGVFSNAFQLSLSHFRQKVAAEAARRAAGRGAGLVQEEHVEEAPLAAAGPDDPTGKLPHVAYVAASKAAGAGDLAQAQYEKTYDAAGERSPAGKADPSTAAARKAFTEVEKLYLAAIKKAGQTEMGVYARRRLAGAYRYRGLKDKAAATLRDARELERLIPKLIERHQLRREAADWPELAALVRLLHLAGAGNVSAEQYQAAWAPLRQREDEAIGRLMETFWAEHGPHCWRTVKALAALHTPASQRMLLEIGLSSTRSHLPQICGAARAYIAALGDASEARPLLASEDREVLGQAAQALRGATIDKELLDRLTALMKSPAMDLRRLVVAVLGDDPGGKFADQKVAAIVAALPDIAEMDEANATAWPGSWTNAEMHYRLYIDALAKVANGDKQLAAEAARAQAGGVVWRCLVLARAFGGRIAARANVRRILSDRKAGMFRAWAAEALGKLGGAEDLPLLREVAKNDPLQRKQGGCRPPQNEQLYYPVRQAAQRAIRALESAPFGPAGR